jgi:methylenetetrahydrofolate reductase (NADPH)
VRDGTLGHRETGAGGLIAQIYEAHAGIDARRVGDVSVLPPMNSSLAAKIAARQFVVTGELTPPKGTDLTKLFAAAELLRGSVDALNITESPRARMAMDPRAVGKLLQDRGIEVIIQVTSRDRNRIAVQSDLLGAAALGLHNFVFMGGDSPAGGDHPDAKPVFDLTASGLLQAAEALRNGKDYAGNALLGKPDLFLGATANPGATNFEAEVENTRRKMDAGAKLLQTQAVYHVDQLKRFIDAVKPDGVAVLAGIIPLKSEKSGPWLNANLPGVSVPADMLEAMEAAAREGKTRERGVELAARLIREMRGVAQGVHIMAIGGEAEVPEILRQASMRSA